MFAESSEMSNLILFILGGLTLLVFLGVIYAIISAIFMFIFSNGDEAKIKKARASIRYAILGFILTLIILIAVPGFLRTIKVPGYKQYTSGNVFKSAKDIVSRVVLVFHQTGAPIDTGSADVPSDYNL